MISEFDRPILEAFIEREAKMYRWTDEHNKELFISRMWGDIVNHEPNQKLDYIHIQSISNMGLLTSELVLTAADWGLGKSMYCLLPPSPRGSINFSIKEGK